MITKYIRLGEGDFHLPPSACAAGYFDGLHKGHQKLIEQAVKSANDFGLSSAVMTFDPDPWVIFHPDRSVEHLTTLKDKEQLLENAGIDLFLVCEFSREFALQSIEEFHRLIQKLNIRILVCGFDYTYASYGKGNCDTLRTAGGFKTVVVDSINDDQKKISSTRMEELIVRGNVLEAARLCGFYWSLSGRVEAGFQRGRKMECPTANLQPDGEYIRPAFGVYAGYACTDGKIYRAMINVGYNPTFENNKPTIEGHLLDASLNLYGKEMRFFFSCYLRPEKKFNHTEMLMEQLRKDRESTLEFDRTHQDFLEKTMEIWHLSRG